VYQRLSDQAPERKPGNPMADPTAKGLGPRILVTDGQRFDAVRAVTKRAEVDGWTVDEARQAFDVLGLLPGARLTGPTAVACPTCCAAPGSACTTLGSRKRFTGTHKARMEAA
jgi:hypothetical protein